LSIGLEELKQAGLRRDAQEGLHASLQTLKIFFILPCGECADGLTFKLYDR
jgi:hypothetical protein